jgi:naringenin degradation protein FdeH
MMTDTRRVIVTENNAAGKSTVLKDKQVERSGVGVFNFWQTFSSRAPDDVSGQREEFKFFPDAGGTQFRLYTIPPEDRSENAVKINPDDFFKHVGWPGAHRDTTRHPLMHVTPTVDYILLLSGEISLLLEEGDPIPLKPFDAVVQRGTNHWWLNTGKTTALMIAVMVGQETGKAAR